jgi:hypothetical protein
MNDDEKIKERNEVGSPSGPFHLLMHTIKISRLRPVQIRLNINSGSNCPLF